MTLLLMAAGSGSRYGKLKQFDSLGPKEEFLMEFSIYDAIDNGFDHIVVITKAANQEFLHDYLKSRLPNGIRLDVLVQDLKDIPEGAEIQTTREKPWGTAHAVWTARNVISGDFVIINADDYYGKAAFLAAAEFMRSNAEKNYALVGYKLKDTLSDHGTVSRGVCKVNGQDLIEINERTKIHKLQEKLHDDDSGLDLDGDAIVSMNFWICNDSIFNYIEGYFSAFLNNPENLDKGEIYLPFVAQEMMSENLIDIKVLSTDSQWFGVTYYDDKVKAVETLSKLSEEGLYPSPLWKTV